MLKIKVNKTDFDKINTLLPDVCPNTSFALINEDENLMKLGFCDSATCVVEFDMSVKDFYEMLDTLNEIEIEAFNTNNEKYSPELDLAYKKYLKYGCLYDILYNSERIYNFIGKVKYVGKSIGAVSITDGKVYSVIDIEDEFIRIIDDSGEDYLYSIIAPCDLTDPSLCGKWEIIEDSFGALKDYIK